jgi:hypothetical protein
VTDNVRFTPAQLATLDQYLTNYDAAVDQLVQQAGSQVYLDGRAVGTAVLADHLANELADDQLASVAAIALVRLAHARTAGTQIDWQQVAVKLARTEGGAFYRLTTPEADALRQLVDADGRHATPRDGGEPR